MYLIPSVFMTSSGDCYYSSLSSRYANQQTFTGFEQRSTGLRGHLHAINQGLKNIENLFGLACLHHVDVLINDAKLVDEFQERVSKETIPDGRDADLWAALIARKPFFRLSFVSSPAESDHLQTIWKWSATPPERAELPWIETNPQLR